MTEASFRRLLLRFSLVPVLSLCAFLAILAINLHQITVSRREGSRATALLLLTSQLLQSTIDEETGIRGYLAADDPLFLQPYREASARLNGELLELSTSARPIASMETQVNAVAGTLGQFDAINQALLSGHHSKADLVDLLKKQKAAMDRLRMQLGQLMSEEANSRTSSRQEIDSLYETLPAMAAGGAVLIAIVLVWHGILVFRQITAAFARQLNESEIGRDSLATTLQSIGDAVIVCDTAGTITLINGMAQHVTGWTQSQAIGRPLNEIFRIVNEYDRKTVESPVDKVLRSGQVVGLANHTILLRKDGSEISIDDSGAPIRGSNDRIVGVVLVFRDIEARRKAERELEQRTAELESLLFIRRRRSLRSTVNTGIRG